MLGIINVYKEKNMTSFDVISNLRKMLKTKKIGHTGTLDPNATGVLPICIGEATKLVQYILNEDKQYFATIKLGIKTDSLDITGNVIKEEKVPEFSIDTIKTTINSFIGKSMQIPPMYSAIKLNGKKLYELARQGIEVEREARKIEIYKIEDIEYSKENSTISLLVDCSKGTYIRTLCEDICTKLGTIGTVLELERTKTGVFEKSDSYTLSFIEHSIINNDFDRLLYNIEDVFPQYSAIQLPFEKLHHFINGVKLSDIHNNGIYKIYCDNKFIGLGEINNTLLKRKFVI